MTKNDVISFWFEELTPKQWWMKDDKVDELIAKKFTPIHSNAVKSELFDWRGSPIGALAEIIVLDQFSRNLFRGDPRSWQYDPLALALAQSAIEKGFDQKLEVTKRAFLYMPFMHSESILIHNEAKMLFDQPGMESNLEFEQKHVAIIEKFGRYPHRNQILGRESTKEEIEFLKGPNSGF